MIGVFPSNLMSETITLSINEFRALFSKAFEGLFSHDHDFYELANLVIWLECRQLHGVKTFLNAEEKMLEGIKPVLSKNPKHEYCVDGSGLSLLAYNDLVCDLAIARAQLDKTGVVHVSNTSNPEVIIASVARCVRSGLAAAAWWPDKNQETVNIARQSKADESPLLAKVVLPPGKTFQDVTLISAQNMNSIETQFSEWFEFQGDKVTEIGALADNFKRSLDHGIELAIDDYRQICRCAERILVEATEASRRGAGA